MNGSGRGYLDLIFVFSLLLIWDSVFGISNDEFCLWGNVLLDEWQWDWLLHDWQDPRSHLSRAKLFIKVST